MPALDPLALRQRLDAARVLLVFTPELVRAGDPLEVLLAVAPHVDLVQVRPKPIGGAGGAGDRTTAADARDWTRRVLAALERAGHTELPVLVNDRVDVAAALIEEGAAGVHVGDQDTPPEVAREVLGEGPLIGLSTHSLDDVVRAADQPVDLLGFGPVFPTATKGYDGLDRRTPPLVGPELAWVAREASAVPVFAIGGIDLASVDELGEVGRVAVGSALLAAEDPAAAARALAASL